MRRIATDEGRGSGPKATRRCAEGAVYPERLLQAASRRAVAIAGIEYGP